MAALGTWMYACWLLDKGILRCCSGLGHNPSLVHGTIGFAGLRPSVDIRRSFTGQRRTAVTILNLIKRAKIFLDNSVSENVTALAIGVERHHSDQEAAENKHVSFFT